jgi:hypothetical protein
MQIQNAIETLSKDIQQSKDFMKALARGQLFDLKRAVIKQVIVEGRERVTDEWLITQCREIKSIFSLVEQSVAEAKKATPTPVHVPPAEPDFTKEALDNVDYDTVKDTTDMIFGRDIPVLAENCAMDTFLRWIVKISKKIVSRNITRFKSIIDQRVWQDMPRKIMLQIPSHYQHLARYNHELNPITLLQNIINNINHDNIRATITSMRKEMSKMLDCNIWTLAAYASDMIFVEEMKRYKHIEEWINMNIPLNDIKAKLTEIEGISNHAKHIINCFDNNYVEMCQRLAKTWDSDIQLNTMHVSGKMHKNEETYDNEEIHEDGHEHKRNKRNKKKQYRQH